MFCRKCGKEIPNDSEFCFKCGAKVILEAEKSGSDIKDTPPPEKAVVSLEKENKNDQAVQSKCPSCGKELHSNSISFCPYCSSKIEHNGSGSEPAAVPAHVGNRSSEKKSNSNGIVQYIKCSTPKPVADTAKDVPGISPAKSTETPTENPQDLHTLSTIVNIIFVCRIISIAAIIIAFILDPLISGNMPKETFEDAANYNSVILFSYLFYGTFFICIVIRIICGSIIAYHHGEFAGLWKFVVIGLIITIIIGALSGVWGTAFILFGLVAAAYIGSKVRDWI